MSLELEQLLKKDYPVPPALMPYKSGPDLSDEIRLKTPIPGASEQLSAHLNNSVSKFQEQTSMGVLAQIVKQPNIDVFDLPSAEINDLLDWQKVVKDLDKWRRGVLNRVFWRVSIYERQARFDPDSLVDVSTIGAWRQTERGLYVAAGFHPYTATFIKDMTT